MNNPGLIPYYKILINRYGSQYINDFFRDHPFLISQKDGEFGYDFYAITSPKYEFSDYYNENSYYEDDEDCCIFSENGVREDILELIKLLKINKIRKITKSHQGYI